MKVEPETQDRLIATLASVRDEDLRPGPSADAIALLADITAAPHPVSARRSRAPFGARLGAGLSASGRLPRRLVPVGVAVVVLLTALLTVRIVAPKPVAAGIKIVTRDGYYVARVTDAEATSEELSVAFQQLGLDIDLQLVPVSPTLVGTIVAIGQSGDVREIETILDGERCLSGGGSCPVGLRVPLNYRGHAEITLGRESKPGEEYLSVASALAPGEILHCSDIHGAPVAEAAGILERRGLTATFQALIERDGNEFAEGVPVSDVVGWYVDDVIPLADREVLIQASPEAPPPLPEPFASRVREGCD